MILALYRLLSLLTLRDCARIASLLMAAGSTCDTKAINLMLLELIVLLPTTVSAYETSIEDQIWRCCTCDHRRPVADAHCNWTVSHLLLLNLPLLCQ